MRGPEGPGQRAVRHPDGVVRKRRSGDDLDTTECRALLREGRHIEARLAEMPEARRREPPSLDDLRAWQSGREPDTMEMDR